MLKLPRGIQATLFGEGEGLEEGHIHILESAPTEDVAASVAEGKRPPA